MSRKITFVAALCAATVLLVPIAAVRADSTAAVPMPADTTAVPEADVPLATFSVDTSAGFDKKHHDSVVAALLADLEREAALKALAGENPSETLPAQKTKTLSHAALSFIGQLPQLAMAHRLLFFGILGFVVFLAGALVWRAAAGAKKEALRFMTTTRLSLMNSEVQRACLHIEKNFADPALDPDAVCAAIITGRPFLEALFEKELGIGIGTYISQVRIHRAKLIIGRNPESDHAGLHHAVGFSDAVVFAAEFKAVTGTEFPEYAKGKRDGS